MVTKKFFKMKRSTPPQQNQSGFPSLTARDAGNQASAATAPPPGSKPYVGKVKQRKTAEDFLALPGTSKSGAAGAQASAAAVPPGHAGKDYANHSAEKPRKGIQTSSEVGKVKQRKTAEDFLALPGTSKSGAAGAQASAAAAPPGHAGKDYANHSAEKPRKGIQTSSEVGKVKQRKTAEDFLALPGTSKSGAADAQASAAAAPPGHAGKDYANHSAEKPRKGIQTSSEVGKVKQRKTAEDFLALPGTSKSGAAGARASAAAAPPGHAGKDYANHSAEKPRKGIQTSSEGNVTNIPTTMIPNQFGIVPFIRAAESDPSLVALALGEDLSKLDLNQNSSDNLHQTFSGPWSDTPCRPQDMDYHVPPEFVINGSNRKKLPPVRLSRQKEDLLFYLFYFFVGDVHQIAAAAELYNRGWRYHMEEKVWISKAPGLPMVEKTSTYERGTYYFFDVHLWRKVAKDFHLDYSKLEGRPQLPPQALP